jgi:PPOX class probable F420-dependent enzyme
MPSGSCTTLSELPGPLLDVLEAARRGVLSTLGEGGRIDSVPVCFARRGDDIVTAVDQKPKRGSELARVRNVARDPTVTLLVDHWEEEWTRLAWVMVRGEARLDSPGSATDELLARYPQYLRDAPRGPVIALTPTAVTWWAWSSVENAR